MNKENSNNKNLLNGALVALAVFLLLGFAVVLADGGDKDDDHSDNNSEMHDDHDDEDKHDDDHEDGDDHDDHDDEDDHDDDHENDEHDSHDHGTTETYEYEDHTTLPAVSITSLQKNADNKWELNLNFENFTIDEAAAGSENEPGVGHAHIYVNDEKITRLFSDKYIFEDELMSGDEVLVELNTNDHKVYTHDGEHVETETTVN